MAAVPHGSDRELELISNERVGAELSEHIGAHEKISDAERAPLGVA